MKRRKNMYFRAVRRACLGVLCGIALPLSGETGQEAEAARDVDALVPMWSYELPEAETLRSAVLAAMPHQPLRIEARLLSKKRSGRIESEIRAEVQLLPGPDGYRALYSITDAFGGAEEQLEILRPPSGPPRLAYRAGDPPAPRDLPDLYAAIKQTDVTWIDLSLSFLWWRGGETVGRERLRGRTCYVVETPAPDDGPRDW